LTTDVDDLLLCVSLVLQAEIVAMLQARANIDPSLTCLVWQKLEEQNPDFFYAYMIQLRVKEQILDFNFLVSAGPDHGGTNHLSLVLKAPV
jgi:uncharacterized protein (TIGR01589 family)